MEERLGAGMGREAARQLWPLVLQLWGQHPLVLLVVGGLVALGVAFGLSQLWEIVRPPPWQPHEVYRPPVPDDAEDRSAAGPRQEARRPPRQV
jgi:hypothetical protein